MSESINEMKAEINEAVVKEYNIPWLYHTTMPNVPETAEYWEEEKSSAEADQREFHTPSKGMFFTLETSPCPCGEYNFSLCPIACWSTKGQSITLKYRPKRSLKLLDLRTCLCYGLGEYFMKRAVELGADGYILQDDFLTISLASNSCVNPKYEQIGEVFEFGGRKGYSHMKDWENTFLEKLLTSHSVRQSRKPIDFSLQPSGYISLGRPTEIISAKNPEDMLEVLLCK